MTLTLFNTKRKYVDKIFITYSHYKILIAKNKSAYGIVCKMTHFTTHLKTRTSNYFTKLRVDPGIAISPTSLPFANTRSADSTTLLGYTINSGSKGNVGYSFEFIYCKVLMFGGIAFSGEMKQVGIASWQRLGCLNLVRF